MLLAAAIVTAAVLVPRHALHHYRARLRAAGVRLTLEELASPRLPEHQAAAQDFLATSNALTRTGQVSLLSVPPAMSMVAPGTAVPGWRWPKLLPPDRKQDHNYLQQLRKRYGLRDAVLPPEQTAPAGPAWEDLAAELQSRAAALTSIRRVCQTTALQWDTDFSNGFSARLPHLGVCKSAVQWLHAETMLALREGRLGDALVSIETQLRISRHLGPDGVLIEQLVRLAVTQIAWNSTWSALQADGWTDPQLARLQRAWEGTGFMQEMARSLEVERAVALQEYDACRRDPSRLPALLSLAPGLATATGPGGSSTASPDSWLDWLPRALEKSRQFLSSRHWAWFRSWDDERSVIAATQAMIDEARKGLPRVQAPAADPGSLLSPETPARHLLASLILPSLESAISKAQEAQARRGLALAAIGLKRHQVLKGSLPEDLPTLVPDILKDIPVDWMDGQPVRYRRLEPAGFRLYSVGADGRDDDGDPTSTNGLSRTLSLSMGRDLVWPEAVSLEGADPATAAGSQVVRSPEVTSYPDQRPAAKYRLEARDQGVVFRHGTGPGQCDYLGARDVWVYESVGTYYMHYDGAGPRGWLACLATSTDLLHWVPKGPVLDFGAKGEDDSASASYGVTYFDGTSWHMFYLGTPHVSPAPDLVPSFPYLTMKARSVSPAGPWTKQKEVIPFRTQPGTYYQETASPGHVIKQGEEFLMFFSASMKRTLGIARTRNLDGPWTIDPAPIVSPEEQIENSSLYFEPANRTWFLFTNHIGVEDYEYTDAVWVYWTQDLNRWDADHKAVVLDRKNCTWSRKCIGLPSVVKVGHRLAVVYDAPGGDSKSHMKRDVGLSWLDLPLVPPANR